jgi:hypothetical protein
MRIYLMKKINIAICLKLLLLSSFVLGTPAFATPAGQDKLHIVTGTPTSNGDSLFSTTVQWRVDGKHIIEGTGLAFISGPDAIKPDTAARVATKVKSALNDALAEKYPNSRGMDVNGPKKQPELTISNKQDFSFTRVTVRDYSNGKVSFDLVDKTFSADGVGVSIDLVYSADVAYIEGFAPPKQTFATGGSVTVNIDNGKSVEIQTKNKSTATIEQELANAISLATYSTSSIIPHSKGGGSRNAKPFDGAEIQLLNLAANSFSIDVKDPSLGVLTKFKFKDATKPADVAGPFKMILIIAVFGAFAYFAYTWYRDAKRAKQDEA